MSTNLNLSCPTDGPHSEDGKLYFVEYTPRVARDLEYACATCLAKVVGARRGALLKSDEVEVAQPVFESAVKPAVETVLEPVEAVADVVVEHVLTISEPDAVVVTPVEVVSKPSKRSSKSSSK